MQICRARCAAHARSACAQAPYSIRQSDDLVWEVDEFLDRELVLAEIELPTEDTVLECRRGCRMFWIGK